MKNNPNEQKPEEELLEEFLDLEKLEALSKKPGLKEKLDRIKANLDDSSNKNRAFLVTFILALIYLLATVGGTTDLELLLTTSRLKLPIVNFEVPLVGFYIMAPIFLLSFHFNLVYRKSEKRIYFNFSEYLSSFNPN